MKKFILAALLLVSVPTYATNFYTDEDLTEKIEAAGKSDMLESYKQGLERVKDKAEVNIKIAELELEMAKLKRETMLNKAKIELMEKNK